MDQAEALRNKMNSIKKVSRLITITSGKGGVGKSNITVNLAIYLSRMGYSVTIIDADLGLGNIDLIMGLHTPYNLSDVLHGEKNIMEIMVSGPENIKIIPAGNGVEELANIDNEQIEYLIQNISFLNYMSDFILVDTGAGISDGVRQFVLAADEPVLVITPEPTSITDGYAMIKTINRLERGKNFNLIVNKVESIAEGERIAERITLIAQKFLHLDLKNLGYIFDDKNVIKSVKEQTPLVIAYPNSRASKCLSDIAYKIGERKFKNNENGIMRFLKFFKKG